jgi:hypothetical protein
MGWQEEQRERYKQQQAEKERAKQQETEQQHLLLKSQFEEQQRIAAEQSAIRERQTQEKLRIEKQQQDVASLRIADGLKLQDAQRQERLRLAREKAKARIMPEAPQSRRSHGRPRKPWFRKNEIIGPLIVTSFLAIAAIIFGLPKFQHFFGLDNQNTTSPNVNTSTPTITTTITPSLAATNSTTFVTSFPLKTLQALCNAGMNGDYNTQWAQFSSTYRNGAWGTESNYINSVMNTIESHNGVVSCADNITVQNGPIAIGTTTRTFGDGRVEISTFQIAKEADGVWRISNIKGTQWK